MKKKFFGLALEVLGLYILIINMFLILHDIVYNILNGNLYSKGNWDMQYFKYELLSYTPMIMLIILGTILWAVSKKYHVYQDNSDQQITINYSYLKYTFLGLFILFSGIGAILNVLFQVTIYSFMNKNTINHEFLYTAFSMIIVPTVEIIMGSILLYLAKKSDATIDKQIIN